MQMRAKSALLTADSYNVHVTVKACRCMQFQWRRTQYYVTMEQLFIELMWQTKQVGKRSFLLTRYILTGSKKSASIYKVLSNRTQCPQYTFIMLQSFTLYSPYFSIILLCQVYNVVYRNSFP